MRKLIDKLNKYTELYDKGTPAISDKEWDDLYFQLKELEEETGTIYPDSPTQSIQYNVVNELEKVTHNHPMLSLQKTKDISEVEKFLNHKTFVATPKLDGLTCSLHYMNGKLIQAETRGNGEVGENVLHNVLVISNVPKEIKYKEELIIDGEIICKTDIFSEKFADTYKNARNFAAGSIRLLDAAESANRDLSFVAWEVIKGFDEINSLSKKFALIADLGFEVVPRMLSSIFDDTAFTNNITLNASIRCYPIDGVVFKFDDIAYGKSLGNTDHHFNNAIAFKFYDEVYETKLLNIEWSMGKTGQISPIALFETLNIDGSNVSRASLSNLSIMKKTLGEKPFKGQILEVSKRNQIIPKIERAKDEKGQWI